MRTNPIADKLTDILIKAVQEKARAYAESHPTTDDTHRMTVMRSREAGALRAWVRMLIRHTGFGDTYRIKWLIERFEQVEIKMEEW